MGVWGEEVFENDEAADFAADVAETSDLSIIQRALDAVLEAGDDIDASTASDGLAAADIVARLRGHFGQVDAYTEKIDKWVKRTKLSPGEEIAEKARAVVDRIRTEPSESLDLWSEDDPAAWLASLEKLKKRLTEAPSSTSAAGKKSLIRRLRSVFRI
jgi:hypothetical protein